MEKLQKLMKSFYKSSVTTSVTLLVIGLLLFFKSAEAITILSYIIGTILAILGLVAVIIFFKESSSNILNDLNIVYGVVTIILGVLIIRNPSVIATFIPFIVGIIILINSAIKLTYALEAKNNEDEIWKSSLIMAIISAVCGIIILFNPFETSVAVFKIIGAFIVLYSVLDIIYMFEIKKEFKEVSRQVKKLEKVVEDAVIIEEEKEKVEEPVITEIKEEKNVVKKAPTKKAPAKKKTTKKTVTKKTPSKKETAKRTKQSIKKENK